MAIKVFLDEVFVVASENFRDELQRVFSCGTAQSSKFYGYCFQSNKLCHYRYENPNLQNLWRDYTDNCGVFCTIDELDGKSTIIFTDPLGQYPVFYYRSRGKFLVTNDFWLISRVAANGEANDDCAFDFVSYYSPLNQETLAKNVHRLTSFEVIKIRKRLFLGETLDIVDIQPSEHDGSYKQLLCLASDRFRQRAAAVLEAGRPVVHLSGGSDSRLAFAALAAEGYRGPVFSFGDGTSQDRLIFQELVGSMGLEVGPIKWFHGPIDSPEAFLRAVVAFNGLKTNNFSNWGSGIDDQHMEVTGFFGEGLLKGFGQIWRPDKKGIAYLDGARRHSAFPPSLYDHVERRIKREASRLLSEESGNTLMAGALFYLRNRSAAHFGAHSVVNNRKFRSIDLIYDPLLLSLLRSSPYPEPVVKKGAIIIDLIKMVHSQELAIFPYDDRVVPLYSEWCREVKAKDEFCCFSNLRLIRRDLARMSVDVHALADPQPTFPIEPLRISGIEDMSRHPQFSGLFEKHPTLKAGLYEPGSGNRNAEKISLATLAAVHWLVSEHKYLPMLK